MVLRLDLSPEAEARLRDRAAAAGKAVDRFVVDVIEEKLDVGTMSKSPVCEESPERWIQRFDAWVNSHAHRGYVADDSRESIYAGRGE